MCQADARVDVIIVQFPIKRKDTTVIYANETRAFSDRDVLKEARSIDAEGTGITGGDPLGCLDRTLHLIRLLKTRFGEEHHIHLYTATIDMDSFSKLENAGLDELRVHPSLGIWSQMEMTGLQDFVRRTKMSVGLEVPSIPGKQKALSDLINYAERAGFDFVNMNELEFSEGNWNALEKKGFKIKDDISSAVKGSEQLARRLVDRSNHITVHYCSSSFKDSVQLRNRLLRRANNVARPLDVITKDGTLLKGVIEGDVDDILEFLNKISVPSELIRKDKEKKRVELASWVLEDIASSLPFASFIVEEYPTSDRLEVEREPLTRR